jgi:hypothetical protein
VETVLVGVMVVVMFVVEYMTSTDRLDVETTLEVGVVETTLDIIEVEGVTGVFGTTLSGCGDDGCSGSGGGSL